MNEGKKTQWLGLWQTRQGVYAGQTIKKTDVPGYAKLIVRYNKFYEAGSNKPRFVYCFATGSAAKAITLEITAEEYKTLLELEEENESLYTYDEVQSAIRAAAQDGANGYTDVIVEDYLPVK